MTEKEYKSLNRYIMYDTIHRLRHEEHQSIQWIADYLGINFRTVKKYLEMDIKEFESVPDPYYLDKKVKLVELFSYHKLGLTNKYTHLFGDS